MNSSQDFVPLKLSMLQNSNLKIYIKMAQNIVPLEQINSDKNFIKEFVFRNKDNDNFFFVKKTDLATFLKGASAQIKKAKTIEDCVTILSAAGEVMFDNLKMNNLSETSLQEGFELIQSTVNGDSKQFISAIIQKLSSNKSIGVQSLVRSLVCFLLAQSLGWQREKNYQNLIIGSILADIGNSFNSEIIHPNNSIAHLGPYANNSDISSIVLHHHENFDGSGPLGLTRHKIHPLAKLLRIADKISLHSNDSLCHGITFCLAEQRNLYEKEPIFKLLDYMKNKKLLKV